MLFQSPGISPKHTPTQRSPGMAGESMPMEEEDEPATLHNSPKSPSLMPKTQEPNLYDMSVEEVRDP